MNSVALRQEEMMSQHNQWEQKRAGIPSTRELPAVLCEGTRAVLESQRTVLEPSGHRDRQAQWPSLQAGFYFHVLSQQGMLGNRVMLPLRFRSRSTLSLSNG